MATDYNKLKVVDLKAELKRLGLPQNGLKAELVARLEEAAAGDGSETPADADADADADTDAPNGDADESMAAVPEGDADAADASHEEPVAALGDTDAAVPEETEITMEDAPPPSTAPTTEPAAATDDAAVPASPPPASQSAGTEDVPASGDAMPTENEPVAPVEPTGALQDSQKRKRRSTSPAPVAEDVARKRSKHDDDDTNTVAAPVQGEDANEPVLDESTAKPEVEMGGTHDPIEPAPGVDGSPARDDGPLNDGKEDVPMQDQDPEEAKQGPQVDTPLEPQLPGAYETEVERDVEPSIHPATSALYIKNFMRPLRPQAVQEHLLQLATPAGLALDDSTVVDFYLDNIRTHAFVVFNSTSAASRVRTALHDIVWPEESNRKPLWVDYMPPQVFHDWVNMEQPSGGRGASGRYEVIYDQDDSGNVTARLEETGAAAPATKAPPLERKPSIPTGPRGMAGIENAPSGPRGFQGGGRTLPVHPSRADGRTDGRTDGRLDSRMDDGDDTRTTRAYPVVSWTPVSIDLVDRRLSAIGAAKTKDDDRDFGKEYKRYFFERGDQLVDRGPEIFLGIRPPHRERERRRELEQGGNPGGGGGFGGGGGGFGGGGFGGGGPGGGRRDGPGGGRRRRRNRRGGPSDAPFPMPHGVPRGGDRYRGTASSSSNFDDRGGGGGRFRGDSYRH